MEETVEKPTVNTPEQMRLDPEDPRHGTENGYSNLKCRCNRCKDAWSASVQRERLKREARVVPDHVHGTENGYSNYRCRCDECRAIWSKVTNTRRKARNARRKAAAELAVQAL